MGILFRIIFVIVMGLGAGLALAEGESCVRIFKASKSLSQKVRDNTHHYWDFVLRHQNSYFAGLNRYEGFIAGDAHPGNFIYSRLNNVMRLFFADIKDAGQGPFIFDLGRLVASTHAIVHGEAGLHSTASRMLDAYLAGLSGRRVVAPESVKSRMNMSLRDYSELELDYVQQATRRGMFKLKPGKREPIAFRSSDPERFQKLQTDMLAIIQGSLPGAELLDIAYRPRVRGGSASLTRYWGLVRYRGQIRIVEFKQIGEPATAAFARQGAHAPRLERIMNLFWPARDNMFAVVDLDGDKYFMRPKKVDVFRVPYKLKTQDDIDFTLDLATYEAYLLGKMHGAQQTTSVYADAVLGNRSVASEDLVRITREYLTQLEAEVDQAKESGDGESDEGEGD